MTGVGLARGVAVDALPTELRIVLGRLIRRLRREHRFPLTQAAVLGYLDRDGPAGISALAAREHVRPQSMAGTVDSLAAAGLVARSPDPSDGRKTLISLTESGRATIAADRAQREGWLADAIERDLSAAERDVLAQASELLRRLAAGG